MGFYDNELPQEPETIDWTHRREVYKLSNGAILYARSEIEAGAYKNKGAELVDIIQDA